MGGRDHCPANSSEIGFPEGRVRGIPFDSMYRTVAISILTLLLGAGAPGADEPPKDLGLTEHAGVELIQIEVIAWPNDGDPSSCDAIDPSDFRVHIRWTEVPVVAVDRVEAPAPEGEVPASAESAVEPIHLVALLFDEWDLYGSPLGEGWAASRSRAFFQARAYLASDPNALVAVLAVGDDLKVISSFEPSSVASAALEAYANSYKSWDALFTHHVNRQRWWRRMKDALRMVDAMRDGRKDVFVLAADAPVDIDNAMEQELYSAEAQRDRLMVHTIDLLSNDRVLPYGLFPLAEAGGGVMFDSGETVTTAVAKLDRMAECRFRISLKPAYSDGEAIAIRKSARLSVSLDRKGFRLKSPKALGAPVERTEESFLTASFSSPSTTSGLSVELEREPRVVSRDGDTAEVEVRFKATATRPLTADALGRLDVFGAFFSPSGGAHGKPLVLWEAPPGQVAGDGVARLASADGVTIKFGTLIRVPAGTVGDLVVAIRSSEDTSLYASQRIEWKVPAGE